MKLIKYTLVVLSLMMAVTSCQDALQLSPEDYYGDGNFWQNEAQVNNFMVGMHKQFRDNQFMFVRLGEMRGGGFSNIDRMNTSLNELPIIEQRIDENSSGVTSWAGMYGPILQINLFISKVNEIGFLSADKRDYLLAQAHALRAYYYFQLLRTYGGVPIRTEPEVSNGITDPLALQKARSTEAEVLSLIKEDVNKSVTLFGNSAVPADKSLWNRHASLMLKGEVYLWSAKVYNTTADLAEAKTALNAITGTSLQPSFANVFSYGNKNNNEIILAIRYRVGEEEMSNVANFTYSLFNFDNLHVKDSTTTSPTLVDPIAIGAPNSKQIIQRYAYTFELFQSYQPGDKRRNVTFYDFYKTSEGTPPIVTIRNTVLVKFLGTIDANKRWFSDDWTVYRESERLLMLAEIANAEGSDPGSFIKLVRDRAFAPDADPSPFVNGSKDANELAIFAERSKEFVYEGKRWYDARRMKYGNDPLVFISTSHPYGVLDKTTQSYKVLWPVESAIWTNDPLVVQTSGYPSAKP
ncbi:MAG: RagB/SusD family nutrient uptake outer membrane protein [Saprospiraceae bacterium]|nr:RagB/SusD family nutrient uptake outer membrane protein [Saprospiraceae bacterium]